MKRFVAPAVIFLAPALGTVDAQRTQSLGVSPAVGAFGLPLPLVGVHANFDDATTKGVGLRLNLRGIALGVAGAWLGGGILGGRHRVDGRRRGR